MSDKPVNRRRFFIEGFRELLKPLAQSIQPLEEAMHQLSKFDLDPVPAPRQTPAPVPQPEKSAEIPAVWLRPPGAMPEESFASICSRCGDCARVCPVQAIQLDPKEEIGGGMPYIDPDAMGCVACEGLQCMSMCPTGALSPIPLEEIKMGTAEWRIYECMRTSGDQCTICVDMCPLGEKAIEVHDREIHVKEEGCIGCGVCQHECPTSPKAIVILPRTSNPLTDC